MRRIAVKITPLLAVAALVCIATAAVSAAAPARRSTAPVPTRSVTYGAYRIEVPSAWPVVDLSAAPQTCVRFDQHAVYLGAPGSNEQCPPHLLGVSAAILVEPAGTPIGAGIAVVHADAGTPVSVPAAAATNHRFAVDVPDAGVTVLASYASDPAEVTSILDGSSLVEGASPQASTAATPTPAPAPSSPSAPAPRASAATTANAAGSLPTVAVPVTGDGFDTCAAPSLGAMQAWAASPYRSVGVYIGGANRACSQANLSGSWVQSVTTAGWSLIPIYVGLQAPTSSCTGCALIDPNQAYAQGVAAGNDAVNQAQAVGIGATSPLFDDMEGYDNSNGSSVQATMLFLAGWTNALHNAGYRSGVYSSGSSGIGDLVARAGTGYPEPDELWTAHWTGVDTTADRYVPASLWVHERLEQYSGDVTQTFGGVTLNIDQDAVDAPLAASGAGLYVERSYLELLGRFADPGGLQWWTTYLDFGGSRGAFASALVGSAEFAFRVAALDYQQVLHRGADPGGQAAWATAFAGTGHNDWVAANLAGSGEYWSDAGSNPIGFVVDVYRDFLVRTPSNGEVAYWVGQLHAGQSTYAVALAIADSAEAVGDGVNGAYQLVLHGPADPGGLQYWTARIQQSGDARPLLAALTATPAAWNQ